MDEPTIDLRDRRGRLIRFAIAVVIGSAVTAVVLHGVRAVAVHPNSDPISGGSFVLLAIGLFVVTCATATSAVNAIARRLARKLT